MFCIGTTPFLLAAHDGLVLLEAHEDLECGVAIVGALHVLAGVHAGCDFGHFVLHLRHILQGVQQGLRIELAIDQVTLFLHQALGIALEILIGIAVHAAAHELLQLGLR